MHLRLGGFVSHLGTRRFRLFLAGVTLSLLSVEQLAEVVVRQPELRLPFCPRRSRFHCCGRFAHPEECARHIYSGVQYLGYS
eukprot:4487934-Prymnesium_polylepis.1